MGEPPETKDLLVSKKRFFDQIDALDDDDGDGDDEIDQGRRASEAIFQTSRAASDLSQHSAPDLSSSTRSEPSRRASKSFGPAPSSLPLPQETPDVKKVAPESRSKTLSSSLNKFLAEKPKPVRIYDKVDKDPARTKAAPKIYRSKPAPEVSVEEPTPSAAVVDSMSKPKYTSSATRPVSTSKPKITPPGAIPNDPSKPKLAAPDPPRSSVSSKPDLASIASIPRAPGKKKRDAKIQYQPAERQIFKDLVFYFFPNNDIHTARRMRIAKALEYGAIWVKEWCPEATHVIVDKSFKWDQIAGWMKMPSFPGYAVVVNEIYPSDCIMHRFLVDPKQSYYQVPGYAEATKEQAPKPTPVSSAQSSQSLQLKPAKKNVLAHEPETQPRTDESSHEALRRVAAASPDEQVQPSGPTQQPTERHDDALEAVISETKAFRHLPLDLDEDAAVSHEESNDDTDSEEPAPKKPAKKTKLENFQCMTAHSGQSTSTNPNAHTIDILTQMGNYYTQTKDEWRSRAYRRAIASLRKQTQKITTAEEALSLPFIGSRLASKIEEIVCTQHLRRLDAALADPSSAALTLFLGIYGVGLSQASRWVAAGYTTLADLEAHVPLTANQRVGIAHHADFAARIPRAEVAAHADVVRAALHALDPSFEVTVGGSFRRGARDCGDIDLLITAPGASAVYLQDTVLDTLVPQLLAQGFLTATLAMHRARSKGNDSNKDSGSKWHGACTLPPPHPSSGIWRRLDLLLVPWPEMGAALIYFTGNDIFNRSIRLLASRLGMRLNQRGLFRDVLRGRGRVRVTEGELVEGRSERGIFEVLGVPWREPGQRVC